MDTIQIEKEAVEQVNGPEHNKVPTDFCPTCISGVDPTTLGDGFAQILEDLA